MFTNSKLDPSKKHGSSRMRAVSALALVVTTVGASAAALVATAASAGATTTGGYGYVWANQPSTPSYTPSTGYSANSTGAHNTVVRNSTGNYTIIFPGLGSAGGGNAEVTPFGTNGFCKVGFWYSSGSAESVNVLCFAAGGASHDEYFDAMFSAASLSPPNDLAYLWADQASPTTTYTPDLYYQHHPGPDPATITRTGKGYYNVAVPEVSVSGGTVKVSGYGPGGNRNCRADGWSPGDFSGSWVLYVEVVCTDAAGIPADSQFSMMWVVNGSLLAKPGGKWAYVSANNPTSAADTPPLQGNYTGAVNTVTRSTTGSYIVDFPYLGGANGDVQVTAEYLPTANCNPSGWFSDGHGGAAVYVNCYDPTGAPFDASFTAQYFVS